MLLSSLANTGPGIVARDLCEQFQLQNHYCEIFYFDNIFGLQTTCRTTKISGENDLKPSNWDVIHSHGFRPDRFVCNHLYKEKGNCKFVTTLHQPINYRDLAQTYNLPRSIVGAFLWHRCLKTLDAIVVLNNDTYNSLPYKYRNKTSVIFNGRDIKLAEINCKDKHLLSQLKQNYKIIGTSSSITKRKGLEQIVKALPSLKNFAFVAIGEGDQKEKLEKLSKKLGVNERCVFLGYRQNSTAYLPYFDLFIMCTRSEGFPLAFIEAASQGIPTVLSDIPILKSIANDSIVDFYHLDDIFSLSRAVFIACEIKKGHLLKQYYSQNLTARIMASKYLELYRSI